MDTINNSQDADRLVDSDPTYNGSITPDEIKENENSTVENYALP